MFKDFIKVDYLKYLQNISHELFISLYTLSVNKTKPFKILIHSLNFNYVKHFNNAFGSSMVLYTCKIIK